MSEVRKRLREELESSGVDQAAAFDCLVAATEACSNALIHGHTDENSDRPPQVEWDITPRAITLVIRDFSSHGWEATSYPSTRFDAETTAPEERIGGLGLTLMSALMDEIDIDRTAYGTTVTLTKLLRATASSAS